MATRPLDLMAVLEKYKGMRLDDDPLQPRLPGEDQDDDEASQDGPDRLRTEALSYEMPISKWVALSAASGPYNLPRRFIDGRLASRTVARLADSAGRSRPVILAHIGAVALSLQGASLVRESVPKLDTVLCFICNGFNHADLDTMANGLAGLGIRLVRLSERSVTADFEVARRRTFDRVIQEMQLLEQDLLFETPDVPTIIDGLIEQRTERTSFKDLPEVTGVIKTLQKRYLHQAGQTLLYDLEPAQRTPAFQLVTKKADLVSWYVRLSGQSGAVPSWGVVRVEMHRAYFEGRLKRDFGFLNTLSSWLFELRCRDSTYTRAAVSLDPIVRAEEHLTALLPPIEATVSGFHLAAGL